MQNCTNKQSYLDAPSKEIITTSGTYVLLLFLLFPQEPTAETRCMLLLPPFRNYKNLTYPYENTNKKGLAQTNHKNQA